MNLDDVTQRLHTTLPIARIEPVCPPGLESITLGLINSDFPTGPLPQDVMRAVIAQPAYWSFCWGSGIALAQRLLKQDLRGTTVADLGCGSGVVAIAAKQAGASTVWACDNDADALAATQYNARMNAVELQLCADAEALPDDLDLLLMADVLYDRSNFGLIEIAKRKARHLVIADSRVSDVEDATFQVMGTATALTFPNLGEFDEFSNVRFFEALRSGARVLA